MEYLRCRKVKAVILTTVFILSFFGQNVSAASNISTETFYKQILNIKQTIFSDVAVEFRNVFASISQSGYVQKLKDKLVSTKDLAVQTDIAKDIVFVIEQIPLEEVLNKTSDTNVVETQNIVNVVENQSIAVENQSRDESRNTVKVRNISRGSAWNIMQEELDLLARIIYAEARGESFEGQVAVGAVVLNRVEHPAFPETIKEVIYEPGQFSAVRDKQIELTPNETAYKAAEAALAGHDPSGGAIFYYNPRIATDPWIRTRNEVKKIGNHKFCI